MLHHPNLSQRTTLLHQKEALKAPTSYCRWQHWPEWVVEFASLLSDWLPPLIDELLPLGDSSPCFCPILLADAAQYAPYHTGFFLKEGVASRLSVIPIFLVILQRAVVHLISQKAFPALWKSSRFQETSSSSMSSLIAFLVFQKVWEAM